MTPLAWLATGVKHARTLVSSARRCCVGTVEWSVFWEHMGFQLSCWASKAVVNLSLWQLWTCAGWIAAIFTEIAQTLVKSLRLNFGRFWILSVLRFGHSAVGRWVGRSVRRRACAPSGTLPPVGSDLTVPDRLGRSSSSSSRSVWFSQWS